MYRFIFVLSLLFINIIIVNAQDSDSDLFDAVINKDEKKVYYLLKAGIKADIENDFGVSPLMFAAESGNLYITGLLIENGANVNKTPSGGTSAIIAASKKNNIEIVELLLKSGADINSKDNEGNTSLIYCADRGYPLLADLLCANGADISIQGKFGDALIVAAYYGDSEVCDVILDYKGDINTKDAFDFTPLMCAAQGNYLETVKFLVEKNADLNLKNFDGFSALDLAVQNGHKEIVEYLLSKGAKVSIGSENNISSITIAELNGQDEILKIISGTKKSSRGKPYFSRYTVSTSFNFNNKDFLLGNELNICESKYKFNIVGGYLIRPYRHKVLIQENTNLIFRYREQTNLMYAGLRKRLPIISTGKRELGFFLGAKESFRFGSYKGSEKKVRELISSPEFGYYYLSSKFSFMLNYEYSNFKTLENNPHRINLSMGFVINKGYKYSSKYIEY